MNGQLLGSHRGAYDPFTLELPQQTEWDVVIRVWDPTDSGCAPWRALRLESGGDTATSCKNVRTTSKSHENA